MTKSRIRSVLVSCLFVLNLLGARPASAGGVTLITHGLNGDVDGWITATADAIPDYPRFSGTNFTCYEMYFFQSGQSYFLTATNVSGSPAAPGSGEIIVKLDWRQLADGNSYDTYQIAAAVAPALLSTNFIPELGGHALSELPLHLVGHSRGGSLVCEISRLLGTNGVWVEHLTTLDPHPLNDPSFPFDFIYSDVDAPANTYVNVLFHDNYWQDASYPVSGKFVKGAYIRELTSFSGGYNGLSSEHSDVHLWYHGTINTNTPTSYVEDGSTITINSSMRTNWWNSYESRGAVAGFFHSLVGGGDRLSTDHPLGAGASAIVDGFNQVWDLGAGSSTNNRTALTTNYGNWPNLIRLNRTATNPIVQGQGTPLRFYYQWARPASNATVSIYLDDDLNPLNTNQVLLHQFTVPGNSAGFVGLVTTNITLAASNAAPGIHNFFASITGGGRTRYLYAPEPVEVLLILQPPVLDIARLSATEVVIGVNGLAGQTILLQQSPDLQSWQPLATNTLTSSRWVYTNSLTANPGQTFYRARLTP